MNLSAASATPLRVAVALSGGGRTLANLLTAESRCGYKIVGVISSSSKCAGNMIAQKANLPLFIGNFSPSQSRTTSAQLGMWLDECRADLVALAGFLKIFPLNHRLGGCVVNIHPALLPKFGGPGMYGMHVHEAVIAGREKESGATVHVVNDRYDDGRKIGQVIVDVEEGETPHSLAAKVFAAECDLYPQVLHKISLGELTFEDGFFQYRFTPPQEES